MGKEVVVGESFQAFGTADNLFHKLESACKCKSTLPFGGNLWNCVA